LFIRPLVCRTKWTGEHDGVAIRITQPAFPVSVLTPVARFDDVSLQLFDTCNRSVEVIYFKPQEHAVSSYDVGITEATMLVLDIPAVQLKNEPVIRDQPLILAAPMPTLTPKKTLIPATARFNIAHAN